MERLLKPSEVCERLSISRWTLYKWIKEGRIKAVRLPSGKLRIPESEVERIVKGQ